MSPRCLRSLMTGCLLMAALVPGRILGADPAPTNKWAKEISAFAQKDAQSPPPRRPILFTGSSSVRMWTNLTEAFPGRPVLNRGFGGSHFSDLLEHFDQVVAPYAPSVILVYEGDNDIASGKTPDRVLADFNEFRRRVRDRFPDARCGFLAIKGSPSRLNHLPAHQEANRKIRDAIQSDPQWTYLDTYSVLLDPSGQPDPACFVEDRLHLNGRGYLEWQKVVTPWLEKVAGNVNPVGAAPRP
jgi:lysophospholipase L1-like esterase